MRKLKSLIFTVLLLCLSQGISSYSTVEIPKSVVNTQHASINFIPYVSPAKADFKEEIKSQIEEGTRTLHYYQYFTGTNYYFSSSGSTGNTGLSISSPWPESKISVTGAGDDSLLLKKDDTFTGTISYSRSGTSGHPINFGTYGHGSNPIIDGGAETTSALVTVTGNYITFNSLIFQNARHINGLLFLSSVHDITVYNCYFNTGKRGINAVTCGTSGVANLSVTYSYFTNIFDDLQTSGQVGNTFGAGSHIQLNNCNGAGIEIAYNNFYIPSPSASNNFNYGVGDVVSLYQDNGTSASSILVHDNNFRGASNNQYTGYIWITMGDVGGSYQHVYNNKGANNDPASQGGFSIMPSGGTNIIEENNYSYCVFSTNTHNAVGMGFAGVGSSCTVQNNHLTWYAYGKGGVPYNKWFDTGTYTAPTGWSTTNTADTAVDPLAYNGMLPDPLWTGTPWNTNTTYYFSSSGSTSNTGLSISSPWPESKVSSVGIGGDSLLFKKGDTFTGTINYTRSGVSGRQIVFDCYGTAHNNPILDGGSTGTATLTLSSCSYININNLAIVNSASVNGNLYVTSANHDININNVYSTGGYRGFYFYLCGSGGVANLTVKNCYFYNIGVGGSRASGSGSSVQMNGCNGAGIEVAFDKAQTDMTLSVAQRDGVGDVFNFYQCNGTAASYILAHDLNVRGGGSSTSGYAGLILGDVGGSYQNGYNNIFVQSGAEGFQIQGGTFIIGNNNKMYSPTFSYCFEGIGYGNYSGAPCNNITITNNKVNWTNGSGSSLAYWIDSPGNSGLSTQTGAAGGATLTADFTGTTSQFTRDLTMDNTLLPDPLYSVSSAPWNTITTPLSFSPLANATVGTADYSPGAVSSSNQGITYTSDNTAVATIVSGNIHVVAAGTANITANDQFNTITQSLTVTSSSSVAKFKRGHIHTH